ncbi:Protein RTA1 [Cytospora mali]|uniref:Protein RTA1 n=1 Tax=Cytospora mali TaxID=578113 RepID=A0A194UMS0_CYTMA|nr:Protein RTA1 [Valsa mali var. pyri (nom. inval.)]
MSQILPYKDDYYLWNYVPSIPGAVVFIVLFGIAMVATGWRLFRYRAWFHIPLVIGCEAEVIGYVAYIIAHNNTNKLSPYLMQSVCLLVAPPLISATLYMMLGRLTRALPSGEECSLVRTKWLTKGFILLDVEAFLIVAAGGGMMISPKRKAMGQIVIISGLIMQIVCFVAFVAACGIFHVRYARLTGNGSDRARRANDAGIPWRKLLYMLYATSFLISVRSIYRSAEFIQGHQGYNLTHQWTLFVFDATLMFLSVVVFYVMYHPKDMSKGYQDVCVEGGTVNSMEMAPTTIEEVPLRHK